MKHLNELKEATDNQFEEIIVELFEELNEIEMNSNVRQTVRHYLYKLHNQKVKGD